MQQQKEFVISRVFNAPRSVVFKAWTEKDHLAQWWGPKGMKIEVKSLDVRPGGMFHYSMELPNGQMWWGRFIYREISEPDYIVFINSFSDEEGKIARAPFTDKFPLEVLNKVSFTDEDGKTRITLRGGPLNATSEEQQFYEGMFASMQQGFTGTFDQLEEFVAQPELQTTK